MDIAGRTVIRRITVRTGIILLLLLLILSGPGEVRAQNSERTEGAGFCVRAKLPENQRDKSLSYFDLWMHPSKVQDLTVEITNESAEEMTIAIAAVSASTNRNGIIDYKTPNIKDKTLNYPFSEIAYPEQRIITIPACEKAHAKIRVAMPQRQFDGIILGGISFTRTDSEDQDREAAPAVGIRNTFSYVLGVKLQETEAIVQPAFELAKVRANVVDHQPAVIHYLRNREAQLAGDIQVRVTLKDKQQRILSSSERTIDMAPNSVMPLSTDLSGTTDRLAPGQYLSTLELTCGGRTSTITKAFYINAEKAKELKAAGKEAGTGIQFWGVCAGLLLILIILVTVLIAGSRRKKRQS